MQTSGFVEIMALANWPVKDHISEATHLGPRHQLVQWNYDKGMVCKTSFGAGMAWSCMVFVWVYQVFRRFFNGIIMCSWEHFCKASYLSLTEALPFATQILGCPARWQVPLWNLKVLEHCKGKVHQGLWSHSCLMWNSRWISLSNPKWSQHVLLLCTPNQPANLGRI